MILPTPVELVPAAGRFTLTERTTVRADGEAAAVADLLRTLLRPATGLPLAPGAEGTVALVLAPDDRELGEEGYRLTVDPFQVTLHAARPAGLRHACRRCANCCRPRCSRRSRWPASSGACPPCGSPTGPGTPGAGS